MDGGRWRLYTGPFEAPSGARVEARAVRYGWRESEVVSFLVPPGGRGAPKRVQLGVP
jgi:hypothetical protein